MSRELNEQIRDNFRQKDIYELLDSRGFEIGENK